MLLKRLLAHPLTRGLDIDDPSTTSRRRAIIESKPFLKRIYQEWYETISGHLPDIDGPVLELGSGAGFLSRYVPRLITSEIFNCPGIQVVLDGQALPIAMESLRAIVMTDVLHHVPDPRRFFREAARCLRVGGRILLIEPWVSRWSRIVYTHLHHEPFQPDSRDWTIPLNGPLSGANGAMPAQGGARPAVHAVSISRIRRRVAADADAQHHLPSLEEPGGRHGEAHADLGDVRPHRDFTRGAKWHPRD